MVLEGKKVLIIGMAKSGIAAAQVLAEMGAQVTIADQKKLTELREAITALEGCSVKISAGGYPTISKENFDLLVTSPGVPATAQPLCQALSLGVPIWSEIELAARLTQGSLVAITGTNGKTTTTALVGQMFKDAGRKVIVGGNIGQPLVEQVRRTAADHVAVVEVSSFQLEWVEQFHPKVAVLTNITPDHLDRHGTIENYVKVKARVFGKQNQQDYTVLNYDDLRLRELAKNCPGRVLFFSRLHSLEEGIIIHNSQIVVRTDGKELEICPVTELKIPGAHNLENAMAAVGVGWAMGLTSQELRYTLSTFPGVVHRLELAGEIQGVTYINDSKGTNPDASIKALEAFDRPLILIAGGSTKGSDFSDFAAKIKERVKHLVVLGQTADAIIRAAESVGFKAISHVATLNEAVQKARALAEPGDIVLLSPACASYDMFKNYEHRGETFKELVRALK